MRVMFNGRRLNGFTTVTTDTAFSPIAFTTESKPLSDEDRRALWAFHLECLADDVRLRAGHVDDLAERLADAKVRHREAVEALEDAQLKEVP